MKMIIMIMMRSRFPFRARHPLLSSRHYPQRGHPRTPRFRLVQWTQKGVDHHDNGTDDPQIVRCASIARAGWTWPMVLDLSMGSKLFLHLLSAFCFLLLLLFSFYVLLFHVLCVRNVGFMLFYSACNKPFYSLAPLPTTPPPSSYIFLHFLISKFMIHYMNKIPTQISILL